jgi:O-antigen/teichoic acid export membrane protein
MTAATPLGTPQASESDGASARGSVILLAGRCIAIALNLAAQVMTVRYFTKLDYGAFAFVLSVVSISSTGITLGMDKTLSRYAAMYHEDRDWPKLFGALTFSFVLLAVLGLACVAGVGVAGLLLGVNLLGDELTSGLLLVLVLLAPLNALDSVFVALFGVFSSPVSIVVRRHILGPALKLAAVLVVIATAGNMYLLAAGHVIAVGLGTTIGAFLLFRLFRRDAALQEARRQRWEFPVRELLGHSLPLMSTDFVMILRTALVIVFLEVLRGSTAVAEYRAVFPLARLNELVVTTLAVLFIPMASRIFTQQDKSRMHALYWQTASSLAVLSFPVFAATFVLSEPLTVFLLGEQYQSSAAVLGILALGCYVHTSLGFNSQTLRVYGRVRAVVATDVIASAAALLGYAILIPSHGPLGAAIATAGGLVLHNLLNQCWLVRSTDVRAFDPRYLGTLASIVAATVVLLIAQYAFAPHVAFGLSLTALLSLLVFYWNRDTLNLGDAFPALARFPFVYRLVSSPARH